MRKFAAIALVALATACATTEAYDKILQSFVGRHVDQLVVAWGPPQASHTFKDGRRIVRYFRSETVHIPETRSMRRSAASASGLGSVFTSPAHNLSYSCRTTFDVDASGTIAAWKREGNDCRARPK